MYASFRYVFAIRSLDEGEKEVVLRNTGIGMGGEKGRVGDDMR